MEAVTKEGEISQVWVRVWMVRVEGFLCTVRVQWAHVLSHGPAIHETRIHAYVQRKSDVLPKVSNCYVNNI